MSNQEFENYLALVGGLLRRGGVQREEISDELRDHLDERLAELEERGVPREEAVRQALAEFGDAVGLTAAYLTVSRNQKKRRLMKWTTASIGGLAATALLAAALWPEGTQLKVNSKAVAQIAATPEKTEAAKPEENKTKEDNNVRTEAALSKQIEAEFVDTPLQDIVHFLQDLTGVEFYINTKKLEEAGAMKETPVTITLKKVRVDMLLDLALAQVGDSAAYIVRDGIVIISSAADLENATEVRVYNCRDLLTLGPPADGPASRLPIVPAKPIGGGFGSGLGGAPAALPIKPLSGGAGAAIPATPAAEAVPAGGGPQPMGSGPPVIGVGGAFGGGEGPGDARPIPTDEASIRAERLMNILTTAIASDSWQQSGGFGSVAEYSGLLVVNHNARTHRQIEKVLTMLREAAARDKEFARPASGRTN